MKRSMNMGWICAATVVIALLLSVREAVACAACYGAADSPMTKGMNLAVFSLLIVVVAVMISVSAFFLFLKRRSRMMHSHGLLDSPGVLPEGFNR